MKVVPSGGNLISSEHGLLLHFILCAYNSPSLSCPYPPNSLLSLLKTSVYTP